MTSNITSPASSISDGHLLQQYLTTPPEPATVPSKHAGKTAPEPALQVLHDRAAESARETRQAIINLASASLGVFFLALTVDITPPLSSEQKVLIAIAVIAMAIAVFAGVWS